MFTNVKLVFLIDISSVNKVCFSKNDIDRYIPSISLCCLRLLTEFGAQTEKGNSNVHWSFKFYNSEVFKPDVSKRDFLEFNKIQYESFNQYLRDKLYHYFSSTNSKSSRESPKGNRSGHRVNGKSPATKRKIENSSSDQSNGKSPSYILTKALQEVLFDYNWDRPDISSPVKTTRIKNSHSRLTSKKGSSENETGDLNLVIGFTALPSSLVTLQSFCAMSNDKKHISYNPSGFKMIFEAIFDKPLLQRYKEKKLKFHIVNVGEKIETILRQALQLEFNKISGIVYELEAMIQSKQRKVIQTLDSQVSIFQQESSTSYTLFKTPYSVSTQQHGPELGLNSNSWITKKKLRAKQRGPVLLWGVSEYSLDILAVKGSSSKTWGKMSVAGLIKGNSMTLLSVGLPSSDLYVCQAGKGEEESFSTMLNILSTQNVVMLLKLECGGLVGMAPWVGAVACLVVFSSSNLASPPININTEYEGLRVHVKKNVDKLLQDCPAIVENISYDVTGGFAPHYLKPWCNTVKVPDENVDFNMPLESSKHKVLLERLQNKYRPQVPKPLSATHHPSPDLIDVTLPQAAAAIPNCFSGIVKMSSKPSSKVMKANLLRAQQFIKKSKIVTAKLKVKGQKAEEIEHQAECERKIAEAQTRENSSHAMALKRAIEGMSNIKDKDHLEIELLRLRDNDVNTEDDDDIYATAQAIINVALSHRHLNSSCGSFPAKQSEIESFLLKILLRAKDINSNYTENQLLRQYKLQTFLHMDFIWVFGYSTCGSDEGSRSIIKDEHIDKILELLRAISLKYGPSFLSDFLEKSIVNNYQDENMGKILLDIYNELGVNDLPDSLLRFEFPDKSISSCYNEEWENISEFSEWLSSSLSEDNKINAYCKICLVVLQPKLSAIEKHADSHEHLKALQCCAGGDDEKSSGHAPVKEVACDKATRGGRVLRRELSQRQIVVPQMNRKKSNEDVKGSNNKQEDLKEVKGVRRNLFERGCEAVKSKLKRSHTIAAFDHVELKSPRRNFDDKKCKGLHDKTPKRKYEKYQTQSNTPVAKLRKRILAPETPAQRRVRKSTGNTTITESPDLKEQTTSRRSTGGISIARHNSFYSGARSRNFEKGKHQLLANKIKGQSGTSTAISTLNDTSISNSNFNLFQSQTGSLSNTKLHHKMSPKAFKMDECKKLHFGFDDDDSEVFEPSDASFTNSPVIKRARLPILQSPINRVKRSLTLTPMKSPKRIKLDLNDGNIWNRPSKESNSLMNAEQSDGSVGVLTPSKRVQFDFTFTPRKNISPVPVTPRSILKTPNKTPCKVLMSDNIIKISPMKTPKKAKALFRKQSFPHCQELPDRYQDFKEQLSEASSNLTVNPEKENKSPEIFGFASELEILSPVKGMNGTKVSLKMHQTPEKVNVMIFEQFESDNQSNIVDVVLNNSGANPCCLAIENQGSSISEYQKDLNSSTECKLISTKSSSVSKLDLTGEDDDCSSKLAEHMLPSVMVPNLSSEFQENMDLMSELLAFEDGIDREELYGDDQIKSDIPSILSKLNHLGGFVEVRNESSNIPSSKNLKDEDLIDIENNKFDRTSVSDDCLNSMGKQFTSLDSNGVLIDDNIIGNQSAIISDEGKFDQKIASVDNTLIESSFEIERSRCKFGTHPSKNNWILHKSPLRFYELESLRCKIGSVKYESTEIDSVKKDFWGFSSDGETESMDDEESSPDIPNSEFNDELSPEIFVDPKVREYMRELSVRAELERKERFKLLNDDGSNDSFFSGFDSAALDKFNMGLSKLRETVLEEAGFVKGFCLPGYPKEFPDVAGTSSQTNMDANARMSNCETINTDSEEHSSILDVDEKNSCNSQVYIDEACEDYVDGNEGHGCDDKVDIDSCNYGDDYEDNDRDSTHLGDCVHVNDGNVEKDEVFSIEDRSITGDYGEIGIISDNVEDDVGEKNAEENFVAELNSKVKEDNEDLVDEYVNDSESIIEGKDGRDVHVNYDDSVNCGPEDVYLEENASNEVENNIGNTEDEEFDNIDGNLKDGGVLKNEEVLSYLGASDERIVDEFKIVRPASDICNIDEDKQDSKCVNKQVNDVNNEKVMLMNIINSDAECNNENNLIIYGDVKSSCLDNELILNNRIRKKSKKLKSRKTKLRSLDYAKNCAVINREGVFNNAEFDNDNLVYNCNKDKVEEISQDKLKIPDRGAWEKDQFNVIQIGKSTKVPSKNEMTDLKSAEKPVVTKTVENEEKIYSALNIDSESYIQDNRCLLKDKANKGSGKLKLRKRKRKLSDSTNRRKSESSLLTDIEDTSQNPSKKLKYRSSNKQENEMDKLITKKSSKRKSSMKKIDAIDDRLSDIENEQTPTKSTDEKIIRSIRKMKRVCYLELSPLKFSDEYDTPPGLGGNEPVRVVKEDSPTSPVIVKENGAPLSSSTPNTENVINQNYVGVSPANIIKAKRSRISHGLKEVSLKECFKPTNGNLKENLDDLNTSCHSKHSVTDESNMERSRPTLRQKFLNEQNMQTQSPLNSTLESDNSSARRLSSSFEIVLPTRPEYYPNCNIDNEETLQDGSQEDNDENVPAPIILKIRRKKKKKSTIPDLKLTTPLSEKITSASSPVKQDSTKTVEMWYDFPLPKPRQSKTKAMEVIHPLGIDRPINKVISEQLTEVSQNNLIPKLKISVTKPVNNNSIQQEESSVKESKDEFKEHSLSMRSKSKMNGLVYDQSDNDDVAQESSSRLKKNRSSKIRERKNRKKLNKHTHSTAGQSRDALTSKPENFKLTHDHQSVSKNQSCLLKRVKPMKTEVSDDLYQFSESELDFDYDQFPKKLRVLGRKPSKQIYLDSDENDIDEQPKIRHSETKALNDISGNTYNPPRHLCPKELDNGYNRSPKKSNALRRKPSKQIYLVSDENDIDERPKTRHSETKALNDISGNAYNPPRQRCPKELDNDYNQSPKKSNVLRRKPMEQIYLDLDGNDLDPDDRNKPRYSKTKALNNISGVAFNLSPRRERCSKSRALHNIKSCSIDN